MILFKSHFLCGYNVCWREEPTSLSPGKTERYSEQWSLQSSSQLWVKQIFESEDID